MQTVPQTTNTVKFDAILRNLAEQAGIRYAGESARIDRGLLIALNGGVTLRRDGVAIVQSQSDPEIAYTVNGHCDCKDAERAPEGRCKHRYAKALVKRALEMMEQDNNKPAEACYAILYETNGILAKVDGVLYFFADCGVITEIALSMLPFLTKLGNVELAETQRIVDTIRGDAVGLCTSRGMEVQ